MTTGEVFKLPPFPTMFTEEDAQRLRELEEQKKQMEEVYQAKFTPAAWAKVPPPEKAVREFLPPWVSPVARAVTPWQWGLEYGFTPEQAQKERVKAEEEYKELIRKERITRVLPLIKDTMRALALTEDVITDTGELKGIFKLEQMGFSEDEVGYITEFAQRLLWASPEEIASGEAFEMRPLSPEDVEELARTAVEPRFVLTTVSLSRNLEDITSALQGMYAPQVEPEVRDKIIQEYIERLKASGVTKETSEKLFGAIAEQEGETLILTDDATGTMIPASKKTDNTVWVEDNLVGYYDNGKVYPLSLSTGQPLITEEAQESQLKDLWDSFYLGIQQAWHGTAQALFSIIPRELLKLQPEREGETEFTKGLRRWATDAAATLQARQDQRELEYQEWLKQHPELTPRPEYTQDPFEHTELFRDPYWYAYTMVSNAPIMGAALAVGIATTLATKNPWAGAAAGAAVITPVQINSVYEDLIANGASPEVATELATGVGIAMGAVEIIPGMIVLKAASPAFMTLFRQNFQKELTKQVVARLSVKGILATAGKIEIAETLEEVIQESMQNAAVKTVNENRSIVENLPQTAVTAAIATFPLAVFGGGAQYVSMKANLPQVTQDEIDATAKKMTDAGLTPDHAEAVAIGKVLETETGQAQVELAVEKADDVIPTVPTAVSEKILKLESKINIVNTDIEAFSSSITAQEERLQKMVEARELPSDRLAQHAKVGELKRNLEDLEKTKVVLEKQIRKLQKVAVAPVTPEVSTVGEVELIQKAGLDIIPITEPRSVRLISPGGNFVGFLDVTGTHEEAIGQLAKAAGVEGLQYMRESGYIRAFFEESGNLNLEIYGGLNAKQEAAIKSLTDLHTEGVHYFIDINNREGKLIKSLTIANPKNVIPSIRETISPAVVEAPAVPEPDSRYLAGLPMEAPSRQETLDKRPRILDWTDEQEAVTAALAANPNIANAIKLNDKLIGVRDTAKRTVDGMKEEQRALLARKKAGEDVDEALTEAEKSLKDVASEAKIGRKTLLAKGWDELTPPEQASVSLTAIPDRSIHFSIGKEIFDIRYYMQFLQEETGLPFYNIFKRAELSHGAARIIQEEFLQRIGQDPHFSHIRTDEVALARVAQEINSRNPALKIESPEGITDEEFLLANVIGDMYRQYQNKVRYLRVMRTTGTIEALKEEFPDAPELELAWIAELRKTENLNDLWDYLQNLEWGVIGSGYDPWMVSYPQLVPSKVRIGTTRGAARLMRRETVEFSELKMEKNVLLRLSTYLKQVEAQWRLEPELDTLEGLWSQAGVKFSNLGQIESALREWTRELQGIPARQSFLDTVVRRVWRQAMGTIFQHIWMPFRNMHQHIAFYPDRTELIRTKELPLDIKEKGRVYFDSFVSQLKGIRRDWLYMGERGLPIPGFNALLRLADRCSMYAHSDNIPRRVSFEAGLNKARRATEQYRVDGNTAKWLKDSGAVHLRQSERNYALQLLAQPTHDLAVPGLREVSGDEMASMYIGQELANMTHFIYERAFRAPVEYGAQGRTLYNLIVFPRGYFQRLYFQGKKLPSMGDVFHAEANWEQARAGFKDIILLIMVGELLSRWLQIATGRKRRSYSPLQIIQWELGGLAVGAFQDVQALINDVWKVLDWGTPDEEKEAALGRIPGALQRTGRVQVPFYRHLMDSIDAVFDTDNIDVHLMRRLREMLDEAYTTEELDEIDRTTWEKFRLAILGGDVVDPTEFQKIQADLMEDYARLGEMSVTGEFYTLKDLGGSIKSRTKPLPDSMLTEEYNFPELIVFYKECDDMWEELYKLPTTPASTRQAWRESHIEEEAMLLFWGMSSKSVFRQGTPEWEQVSSLLRTWFSYYGIDRRMHEKWADWTISEGLTRAE